MCVWTKRCLEIFLENVPEEGSGLVALLKYADKNKLGGCFLS